MKRNPPVDPTAPLVHRYPDPILKDRNQLPSLLNHYQLFGEGAQIGVFHGHYTEVLLREWRGRRIHAIDAWLEESDDPKHIDKYSGPQWQMDHGYKETLRRLGSFADRCHVHRMRPRDAAKLFRDKSLSFVYIDEKHYFEAIWEHLETWARKVVSGGILAGHDYLDGVVPSGHFEVKSAVDRWAAQQGLEVHCSAEPVWPSWIIQIE